MALPLGGGAMLHLTSEPKRGDYQHGVEQRWRHIVLHLGAQARRPSTSSSPGAGAMLHVNSERQRGDYQQSVTAQRWSHVARPSAET